MFGLSKFWQPDIELTAEDGIDWSRVRLQSSEYERRAAVMERYELGEEPTSNVIAVRFAPARVAWTTDPPVTPGLYFCKLLGGSTRVVDVYADDRGRLLASWSDIEEFAVGRPGMLWSNHSIQEPE